MPTFESINFNRELATRLVIVSASSSSENHNSNSDSANNNFTPVETPQALLSRHPLSLRLKNDDSTTGATSISTNPLHCNGFPELRQEVAHKLIALSLPGQRHAKMRDTLLQVQYQKHHQQHDEEGHRGSGSLAYDHGGKGTVSLSIPGTISLLDMLKYQRVIATTRACTNPTIPSVPNSNENATTQHTATSIPLLSTGSIRLDTLLGIIFTNNNNNNDQQEEVLSMPLLMVASCCGSSATSSATSRSNTNQSLSWNSPMPVQGLAGGFVVQCSGPTGTGKTQLALSLAASAAFQQLGVLYLGSALGQGSLRPLVLRLRQLLFGMFQQQPHHYHQQQQQPQLVMACMDRVSFQVVHDGFELLTCLAELEETLLLSQQPQASSNCPRVMILDAASGCLNTEDEQLLQRISLRIKHLARHYHLVVLISNASLMPTTTTSFNKKNNQPKQRSSIDATTESHHYHLNLQLQQQQQQRTHNTAPNLVKPKVALGQAWRKVFDVHISLQRRLSPPPPPPQRHAPRQASQGNPNNQTQQPPLSTTIRATLEAHPFKQCHTKSHVNSNDAESMMWTADFCITAKGIQDEDDDDDDRQYHYASKSSMQVSAREQTE